jgi:aminoglycoside phosphotransferase (APT) family kinase protein
MTTADLAMQDPPGLDLQRLGPWMAAAIPGAGDKVTATLLTGGRSNLTYEVTDGDSIWIVRRPPLGHVLPTAHNMVREYRVLSALHDTEVPVPATFAMCEDETVIGTHFFVMERASGRAYRNAEDLASLGPAHSNAASTQLVDTLAALHAIDPAQIGLQSLGRPHNFLSRQVGRWKTQLDASRSRSLPEADRLHEQLAADVPPDSAISVIHGDYRLDNVLVDYDGTLTAVLDWEMATVGDPLTDLALMTLYQRLDSSTPTDNATKFSQLNEAETLERYRQRSNRSLSHFPFYQGLAAYKLAAILEGIHYRYLHRQTVGAGFDHLGDLVPALLAIGVDALRS